MDSKIGGKKGDVVVVFWALVELSAIATMLYGAFLLGVGGIVFLAGLTLAWLSTQVSR